MLGFLGIIAGALGWWWVVTYFVDKLRGHFTQRTMKRINTVIGIIILIFAAVGIFSSASSWLSAQTIAPRIATPTYSASFRVSDTSMRGWKAIIAGDKGENITIEVTPVSYADPFGDSSTDALQVKVDTAVVVVREGIDPYRGPNAWRIVKVGKQWNLFAGNREYKHILSFGSSVIPSGAPDVVASSSGGISVAEMNVDIHAASMSDSSEADVFLALERCNGKRTDLPGIYSLLDYDVDETYARSGGSYRLALVPEEETGCYNAYYLSGAKANPAMWSAGMKKGRLKPTPFANIFDVEWRDAEGRMMLHDIQAEFDPLANTMTFKFPYQNSTLRLRKE